MAASGDGEEEVHRGDEDHMCICWIWQTRASLVFLLNVRRDADGGMHKRLRRLLRSPPVVSGHRSPCYVAGGEHRELTGAGDGGG